MKEHMSTNFGIKLKVPDNWQVYESQEMGGMQVLPADSDDHVQSGNLSILVRPQGNVTEGDMAMLNYIASEIVRSNFENYENYILHSLRQGGIGKHSTREIIFSYNDKKLDTLMQALQVVTVANENLYLLTYTASVENFGNNLHAVAEIMGTATFEKATA